LIELGFKKENILRLNDSPSMSLLVSNLYSAVFYSGNSTSMQEIILASRSELITIVSSIYEAWELLKEQVVTEDTTASGGNANLLAL
jgi:RHH-type proline utilization regulon transcriptional repressor/proline dehydrogenase/delta 1-pyrroline-5-carboxylate dehydrogenase